MPEKGNVLKDRFQTQNMGLMSSKKYGYLYFETAV